MIYDVIPGFKQQFQSLSPEQRDRIFASGSEVSSIGELMRLTEQLQRDAGSDFKDTQHGG